MVASTHRRSIRPSVSNGHPTGEKRAASGPYDENDFLVHPSCTPQDDSWLGRLYEAQALLALSLLALQQTRFFTADLCERTYNIWLPPAL